MNCRSLQFAAGWPSGGCTGASEVRDLEQQQEEEVVRRNPGPPGSRALGSSAAWGLGARS
jgi:hypothetical protein